MYLPLLACAVALTTIGPVQTNRYVSVDGVRMHAVVAGAGAAPVVFVSGLGEDLSTWIAVQADVAKEHVTVSYDRPGLGTSARSPNPADAKQMVRDLRALLQALHIEPPYVLVGHSLGGYVLRIFAGEYPKDVAGLVFVDPVPEGLEAAIRARMSATQYADRLESIAKAQGVMPIAVKRESDELERSGAEAAGAPPLPAVPIALLTGTKKNPNFAGNPLEQDLKLELHNAFLQTLHHAMHVLVPESRHYIQNDQPHVVVNAIRAVEALRNAPE